jgi:hypothetical protein
MRVLLTGKGFTMREAEFADAAFIDAVFASFRPQRAIHLAFQASVRYVLKKPASFCTEHLSGRETAVMGGVISALRRGLGALLRSRHTSLMRLE